MHLCGIKLRCAIYQSYCYALRQEVRLKVLRANCIVRIGRIGRIGQMLTADVKSILSKQTHLFRHSFFAVLCCCCCCLWQQQETQPWYSHVHVHEQLQLAFSFDLMGPLKIPDSKLATQIANLMKFSDD